MDLALNTHIVTNNISQADEISALWILSLMDSSRDMSSLPIEYEIFTPSLEVTFSVTSPTSETEM
jgi:hypothetical protein